MEVDLDQDDGRWVYDVEVKTANGSSDVEVHAISGKVIKAEYENTTTMMTTMTTMMMTMMTITMGIMMIATIMTGMTTKPFFNCMR